MEDSPRRTECPWSDVVQLINDGKLVNFSDATITGVTPLEADCAQADPLH